MPAHLKQMFFDNISELSEEQKHKFKNLISEYLFSRLFRSDLLVLNPEWSITFKPLMKYHLMQMFGKLHSNSKSKSMGILKNS